MISSVTSHRSPVFDQENLEKAQGKIPRFSGLATRPEFFPTLFQGSDWGARDYFRHAVHVPRIIKSFAAEGV
jgi:hypothetical protein